jgi:hypothetical protein
VTEPEAKQPVTVRATTEYTQVPATRTLFGTPEPIAPGSTVYSIPLTWDSWNNESINAVSWDDAGQPISPFATFSGEENSLSDDGKSMSFTGSYSAGATGGKCAYLYPAGVFELSDFIHNKAIFTDAQVQTGNDNLDHLQTLNRMYSEKVDEGAPFALKPLGAILRFDLTFPDAITPNFIRLSSSNKYPFIAYVRIDYSGGSASLDTYENKSVQMVAISGVTAGTELTAYMMVAAVEGFTGLNSAQLTLTANTSGGNYTKALGTTKSDAYWKPGTCYNFTIGASDWDD